MREQQSSILSEQELHLLASQSQQQVQNALRVYSYQYKAIRYKGPLYLAYSIEQLVFMLNTSQRGVTLVLPDSIESEPTTELNKLITLLTHRNDILVFWVGQMPSMDTDIPVFIHCSNEQLLQENIENWHDRIEHLFIEWLADYPVAFVTNNDDIKKQHQTDLEALGLLNTSYFTATSILSLTKKPKLLIIDLHSHDLHLLNILKNLSNQEWFPIIVIYGELAKNVCHATYTVIENSGFPVLASLDEIPNKDKWEQLFSSLFSKVYLKHWIHEESTEVGIYNLYNLENKKISAYFCVYGINLEQVTTLPNTALQRYIFSAKSIKDWCPDSLQSGIYESLAKQLKCNPSQLDICIEHPEKILPTSIFFSTLVMARLKKTRVYWQIKSEKHLIIEFLKSFPISDVILSKPLSLALLNDPSETLLEFIEQAQLQKVNIIARLAPSANTRDALALYGIESVISK